MHNDVLTLVRALLPNERLSLSRPVVNIYIQLQTTSPESKFPNEYSDVIFIQIDQHLKKLLQKYKGPKGSRFYETRCITRCRIHSIVSTAHNSARSAS